MQFVNILNFLLLSLNNQIIWGQKPAPAHGNNICEYKAYQYRTVMRKNVTTTTVHSTKKCGIPSNPNLMCPETRVNAVIYWYPYQKRSSYNVYKCCPGWSVYVSGNGCTQRVGCPVCLPQLATQECLQNRKMGLMKNKVFYHLNQPIKPDDPARKPTDPIFPFLNQTFQDLASYSMMDPFTAHWFNVYFTGMLLSNNKTALVARKIFRTRTFDKYQDYIDVYRFFVNAQLKNPLPYFKLPSTKEGFPSLIDGDWKLDKYFVEQRLAGLNPMYLQRVTPNGDVGMGWQELHSKLNDQFGWEAAVRTVVGYQYTLSTAIEKGLIYVIEYPMYHDIPIVTDIMDPDLQDERAMRNSTSPITLFAMGTSEDGTPELKAVAIQIDYKKDSPVYTPGDGLDWMIAKAMAQTADFAVVEIYDHLLRTHVRLEPVCVCLHRHLSERHPLYQILRYHCRGMLPVNNYGFPRLTNELAYMHKLFAMGHTGTYKLLNDGYEKMKWGDDDLYQDLQRRGVDDERLLPYYPYRDDGKIIYNILQEFAKEIVDTYYDSDAEVVRDSEIQDLMNELSADGVVIPDGGKGMIKGLPSTFTQKCQLADFIFRVIWLVVQHAAVNYPIVAYGAFTPNIPTKLYYDPRHHPVDPFIYILPGKNVSILQTFVSMNLGTIRYDTMFDYGKDLEDERGKLVVESYYTRMMTEIKQQMETTDQERVTKGHLSYPYLIPGWLPNSIHT